MPVHRDLNHDFFKTWSPEMAYVLGFFAADGSMIRNKRDGHFIEFTITDRIVLEMIRNAVGSTHKIQKRKRQSRAHKVRYSRRFVKEKDSGF
ncbi:MAG: LAGLIDADG family homing endonuclease [Patescibacteria group bacterium]|nr:LAGLIDADG family homing endonuclease [Patescibacteria group bacterium]